MDVSEISENFGSSDDVGVLGAPRMRELLFHPQFIPTCTPSSPAAGHPSSRPRHRRPALQLREVYLVKEEEHLTSIGQPNGIIGQPNGMSTGTTACSLF